MNDTTITSLTPQTEPSAEAYTEPEEAFSAKAFDEPLFLPTCRLPKTFPPTKVMANPILLRQKIVDYFTLLQPGSHPTPPGMAMALGLNSFDAIIRIVKIEEDTPGTYPEESIDALFLARSLIEDHYINGGLRDAMPAQFLKFLLSAYFARSEKIIQETLGAKDNEISINILGVSQPLPSISAPKEAEVIECPQEAHQMPSDQLLTPDIPTVVFSSFSQHSASDAELEAL